VEEYFTEENLKKVFPGKTETEELALKTMALGGQRMRPLLALLAYQSYAGKVSEEVQKTLALVIECFHKASLEDEVNQDNEEFRYNQPALHKSAGIPVAINIGDYLTGKGYQLLASAPFDSIIKAECLKVVAASHVNLSEGQGADILLQQNISGKSVDDILKIFEQKTGEAVKVALLTGANCRKCPGKRTADSVGFCRIFWNCLPGSRRLKRTPRKQRTETCVRFPVFTFVAQPQHQRPQTFFFRNIKSG
jgi:geranylgeranyl pyrophosphate synthase